MPEIGVFYPKIMIYFFPNLRKSLIICHPPPPHAHFCFIFWRELYTAYFEEEKNLNYIEKFDFNKQLIFRFFQKNHQNCLP